MTTATLDGPVCPTPSTLAIVIVNFNSWPDTERLVEALDAEGRLVDHRSEVIVVDNASSDPPPARLVGCPGVRVIRRPDNAGFAAGVNTAWRETSARWLLLLNPDTVAEPDLLPRILGRIGEFESRSEGPPGIVGFALKNEDGSRQHSVGAFPTFFGCLRELGTPRSRRKYWSLRRTRTGAVPWVTGACLLVQDALLEELGGMDEEFFLYHEEVALCRSAWDRGWSVEFDDSIALHHLKPLQSRVISPVLRVVTRHSKLLYFFKFRPRWEALALSWVVAVESRVRREVSRLLGRGQEARAWEAVGGIVRSLDRDRGPRGVEVRRIAEQAVFEAEPESLHGPGGHRRNPRKPSPIRLDAIKKSR